MKVFTYLIRTATDGSYYTGITADCEKRLLSHNGGKVFSTKNKIPWHIVYVQEHADYAEARKHEKWLKKKNIKYKDGLRNWRGK